MIILKSPHEIALMRQAGRIVAVVLAELKERVRPGLTTAELDRLAEKIIRQHGAVPTFKGYRGFPASITTSINEELVHGIPSRKRRLKEGDILSIDCGATYKGWVGDAAITVPVGAISAEAQKLLAVTEQALYEGIKEAKVGNRSGDVSAAIQRYVEKHNYGVVREYTGHGVGRAMHEDPQVPNFGKPHRGIPLRNGMTIALEPMVNMGTPKTRVLRDKWTVVTADGQLSAHFEHTIAVMDGEAQILTCL
ncbi:MAG: type I methionyl aminopeptidase [Caldilineae bacterium]|nr:MAG: type I methionyl aminopeptidase [Caldilineae bacterium]